MSESNFHKSPQLVSMNKSLKNLFGSTLAGKQIFRLIWSTGQTEKRIGEFSEFYGSIFLRTVKGLKKVPKYPYVKDRWILERLFPPEVVYTPEIPESVRGLYEPVYVFETARGEFLPLNFEVAKTIIGMLLAPKLSSQARTSQLKEEGEKKDKKELDYFRDYLHQEGHLGWQLHTGEAIVNPGYPEDKEN